MNKQNKMSSHIDKSVTLFFILIFLSSASLLAYKKFKNAPCKEVAFTIKSKEHRQGELIKFADETEGAEVWNWNFGDSTEIETIKAPIHIFKKPGKYNITLTVNNVCEKTETIIIKEKVLLLDSNKFPEFELPETIVVGDTLKVTNKTPNATTWEWRFGETAKANSDEQSAQYIYKSTGLKTVSLIVNGKIKYIKKNTINVLPKNKEIISYRVKKKKKRPPIKPNPTNNNKKEEAKIIEVKKVPFINNLDFTTKLMSVSKQEINTNQFAEYFCGNINRDIVVNGDATTFLIFCEKIKGKKIKINDLTIFRDEGSYCIKTITISYKKKRFLGVF